LKRGECGELESQGKKAPIAFEASAFPLLFMVVKGIRPVQAEKKRKKKRLKNGRVGLSQSR